MFLFAIHITARNNTAAVCVTQAKFINMVTGIEVFTKASLLLVLWQGPTSCLSYLLGRQVSCNRQAKVLSLSLS